MDIALITAEMTNMKHDIQVLTAKQSNSTKGRDDAPMVTATLGIRKKARIF
jgi:hypothetical protein